MAEFTVNPQRHDPYKNFKFRVKWDGRYVAGISKISALRKTTQVVEHREGGDPSSSRKSPGETTFASIPALPCLRQNEEFEKWANKTWNLGAALIRSPAFDGKASGLNGGPFEAQAKAELHRACASAVGPSLIFSQQRWWS
jgi:hypothetical protein